MYWVFALIEKNAYDFNSVELLKSKVPPSEINLLNYNNCSCFLFDYNYGINN